jgi:CheY-like chemotaxis protein
MHKQMHFEPRIPSAGKILVVDDDLVIQKTLYLVLNSKGYKVRLAGDLADGLAIIHRERPDLILLDLVFPLDPSAGVAGSWDGFLALDWLCRMEEAKDIPIIIISTANPAESEPRALAAGAAAFFPKPLDKVRLLAAIQGLIRTKKPAPPAVPVLKMAL